jgi:transposase
MSSILHLSEHRQYFIYRKETDMRKGFDSLCGIIQNELGQRIMSGDAFIFINRLRTHLKLLVWEHDGFTIVYRRLEKGAFELPQFNLDQDALSISSDQLNFILKGITLSSVKYRKRYQHKSPLC